MGTGVGLVRPLVGRDDERALLRGIVSARPSRRAAFVRGEAGIGKTRLVDDAMDIARRAGRTILYGAATEIEHDRPFGALVDALRVHETTDDDAASAVSRLLRDPGHSALPAADIRYAIVEHLVELVETRCGSAGALLVVEDLHWADPSTLLTLQRLVRRTRHADLVVMCSGRRAPQSEALDEFATIVSSVDGALIDLEPLGKDDVAILVGSLVDAPDESLMTTVKLAEGNPLFIRELVAASQRFDDGGTDVLDDAEIPIPASVRSAVLSDVRSLPGGAANLIDTASVLGSSFLVDDLSIVTGRPATELAPVLADAVRAGIFRDTGTTLAFRHDLVRDAMYHEIPPSLRRALHVHAARALSAAGRPASRIAAHFSLGAAEGDPEAVEWLRRAAGEAMFTAPSIAVDLAERALALTSDTTVADEIRADLVLYLAGLRRFTEAEQLARRLIASPLDPGLLRRTKLALLNNLIGQGRLAEQVDLAARFAAEALDAREHSRFLAESLQSLSLLGDLAEADARGLEALEEAERASDVETIDAILNALATSAWLSGRLSQSLAYIERRHEHLAKAGVPQDRVMPAIAHMAVLNDLDRVDEGDAVRRVLYEMLSRLGVPDAGREFRGTSQFISGRWDEALADGEAALFVDDEGGAGKLVGTAAAVVGTVSFFRDDLERTRWALDLADRYLATRKISGGYEVLWIGWLRALLLEATGSADGGFELLRSTWYATRSSGFGVSRIAIADIVRMALNHGDTATARDAVEMAEVSSRLEPAVRSLEGAALRARGLLENDPDVIVRAVEAYRASPRRADHGMTAEDAGRVLGACGRADEAIAYLSEAMEIYEGLQANRLTARTDALLRSLGVKRGVEGRRGRPKTGWDALTETEQRVLSLISEGLANGAIAERLFISKRTVEAHNSNIMRKLGVSSRAELIALAARRESS